MAPDGTVLVSVYMSVIRQYWAPQNRLNELANCISLNNCDTMFRVIQLSCLLTNTVFFCGNWQTTAIIRSGGVVWRLYFLDICTWFAFNCVNVWFGNDRFFSLSLRNTSLAKGKYYDWPVLMKQVWSIWANATHESTMSRACYKTKTKQT